jgi:ankyrin repeat protein
MRNYFRFLIYLLVAIGFSVSIAGSYDDFFVAIKRDDPATIRRLLQLGFDPNTPGPNGSTGLFLALRERSLNAAEALLEWPKTDIDARNPDDESPLMMAALKGDLAIARRLIARGADVNKPGWAPLHYAATGTSPQMVQLLLDENAYIDAESPNGTTPLMMAAQYGPESTIKLLLEAGADPLLRNKLGLSATDFAHRVSRAHAAEMIAAAVRTRAPRGSW